MLTFLSGLLTPIPLPYLLASVFLAFAAVSHGLLRVSEMRQRSIVEGKLAIGQPPIAIDLEADETGKPVIQYIQMGIEAVNLAIFSIDWKIRDFYCEFDSRVPRGEHAIGNDNKLDPNQKLVFRGARIEANKTLEPNKPLFGRFRYTIEYSRKGSRKKYEITKCQKVEVLAKENNSISIGVFDEVQDG